MSSFSPLEILKLLDERGVRFVLIGGLAAAAQGAPTPTLDIDICYERSDENLEKLAALLRDLDARPRRGDDDSPLLEASTLKARDHFTFKTRLGNLDLVGDPWGSGGFDQLIASAVVTDLGGAQVPVASLDDLIAMKISAGRDKDRITVPILLAVKRETSSEDSP